MADRSSEIRPVTGLVFMKLHSERVPRKNLRTVGGKPLFCWIFEVLASSPLIHEIILNTDSELIAEEVSSRFAVTVHMRPDRLRDIHSNEANQIIAYDLERANGDYFLQTHSTNPLLSVDTLDAAVDAFFSRARPAGFDSLVSVTEHRKRFYRSDGSPVNHSPDELVKTQEISPLLEENSCVYLFSRRSFRENHSNRIGARPFFWTMSQEEALDIDTEDDLTLADRLLATSNSSRS